MRMFAVRDWRNAGDDPNGFPFGFTTDDRRGEINDLKYRAGAGRH